MLSATKEKITKASTPSEYAGIHLLCEFWGCNPDRLNSKKFLVGVLHQAVIDSGASLIGIRAHQFNPHGVTAIALLKESHISIHTWPEWGYAAVDIFTCGKTMEPYKGVKMLKERLEAARVDVNEVRRGVKNA